MSIRRPATTEPAPQPPAASAPPSASQVTTRPRRPRRWLWWLVGAVVVIVAGVLGMTMICGQGGASVTVTPTPAGPPPLTARGRIEPIHQARIGTLSGGVIARLVVEPGTVVGETQEIARVRGADGAVEVLTAPWAGTITSVPVRLGDTVTPGAIVAGIADLRALQVETTDVDEFIISRLRLGQRVQVTVDALDQRVLVGQVVSLTLQPQRDESGDLTYPTTIALFEVAPELRPGMSVRLQFEE